MVTDQSAGAVAAVVVVGALNVDSVMRVNAIPRPGETIVAQSVEVRQGGKGGNQAFAAARLGAQTAMIGAVGADAAAAQVRDALTSIGVDVSGVANCEQPTGAAVVLVDDVGENVVVVSLGANLRLGPEYVREQLRRHRSAVVLVSLEIPVATALAAAETAARNGSTVLLNAAPAKLLPARLLAACHLVIANEHEVTQLGTDVSGLLDAGPQAVIVTRGSGGVDLHLADGAVNHQPAFAVDVVDTTGAGDAFCGGLAWALAAGQDLIPAVRAAAAVGALATRAVGARGGMPEAAELARLLEPGERSPTMRD